MLFVCCPGYNDYLAELQVLLAGIKYLYVKAIWPIMKHVYFIFIWDALFMERIFNGMPWPLMLTLLQENIDYFYFHSSFLGYYLMCVFFIALWSYFELNFDLIILSVFQYCQRIMELFNGILSIMFHFL